MTAEADLPELKALVTARFQQSMSIPETFFAAEEERIAHACWEMARRFHQGGRLLAFGNGASATDAQHVSVEFVHPVIVGKRALPALAPPPPPPPPRSVGARFIAPASPPIAPASPPIAPASPPIAPASPPIAP